MISVKSSVHLLPNEAAHNNSKLVQMKNPHSKGPSYFMIDENNKKLYEVQEFDEKYRSWFIKENVCSDGTIKFCTPYNPAFLILPYLMEVKKNVPLEQLLEDDDYPKMILLADLAPDLTNIADRIGPEYLNVWSYNERSTLKWLSEKVEKMSTLLKEQKERPSATCAISSDKDCYRRLAYGILSESLSEELSAKLKECLNLPEPILESANLNASENITNKKHKLEESESLPSKKIKMTPKQTSKEKALAKSAKGSKSIISFFSKK